VDLVQVRRERPACLHKIAGGAGTDTLIGMLEAVTAIRYVTPLREGGSLPGLMEADDLGTYVVKFHGAGQGRKALIAEVVCASLASSLGLPVPRLVTVEVDPVLAANEPDEEVQDLLRRSPGTNLGVDFLPGALDLDVAAFPVDPGFAGRVLWFDAFVGNVDRSWRNPNMLFWHGAPYLIDHGATLTFHHRWPARASAASYDAREHALLGSAPDITAAEAGLAPRVTEIVLRDAVAEIPEVWLSDEPGFAAPDAVRSAYIDELRSRFDARAQWLAALREAVAAPGNASRAARRNRPAWLGGERS
jgi:hypothetical protein